MLFLAAASPFLVRWLLDEIFTAEAGRGRLAIQWGRTPPSIPTIRRAYSKVFDELVSTDLVSRIPKQWHLLLRKYKMGAWHEDAPEWMLEAFYRAGVSAPLPLCIRKPKPKKGKCVRHQDEVGADEIVEDADPVEEVISDETRPTAAAMSPTKKTKRLERELVAIRKIFPDFSLDEEEWLIAWDQGLTAVRQDRERRRSAETDIRTVVQKDPSPLKKVTQLRMVPERKHRQSDLLPLSKASHHQDVSTNQESEGFSIEAAPAEASNEWARIQVSESGVENAQLQSSPQSGESANEESWILREHRADVLRSEKWEFEDCPIILFPDVLRDSPKDTFQAWLNHDPGRDECGVPMEFEHDYAIEYQNFESEIINFVDQGYLAEAVYRDTFPATHRSLLFCWILERIVARTLKLKSGQIDYQTDKKFIPMAHVWNEAEAGYWLEHWNPKFWAPLTPLRLEMLRPLSASEIPDGYDWISGWGFMPCDAVERAMRIYAEPQSSGVKDAKLRESEWTWAAAVYRARGGTRAAGDISFVRRLPLPGGKSMFGMPFCVDYSCIKFPVSDWMDFSETPGMWVCSGHGEAEILEKLCHVKSSIHLPSLLMIERYLVQRAGGFLEKSSGDVS